MNDGDEAGRSANLELSFDLLKAGGKSAAMWNIAEECPIALRFNGAIFAVMLASPGDLKDFAMGFALSEGIIDAADEFQDCKIKPLEGGIELDITIAGKRAVRLEAQERRRALAGGSGCGLCGVQSFEEFTNPLPRVESGLSVSLAAIRRAGEAFPGRQKLNQLNHSVHGAAFVDASGEIQAMREDVGRHNALDKLIGAVLGSGGDPAAGLVLLSSRAGYELIHKAARTGFAIVVSFSAPTGMALRAALDAEITLASFAGKEELAVFSRPERISG